MLINEIHDLFKLLSDEQQSGYFSHEEIDVFIDRASLMVFGKYAPKYGKDARATEALAPFKKKIDYATNSSGVYSISTSHKYMQLTGLKVTVVVNSRTRYFKVTITKEDERAARMDSQLRAPSATKPVAWELVDNSTGVPVVTYNFFPLQVHAGTMEFLRRPAKSVYGYTQSGRTITYDAGTSTQMEWTEPYQNEVVVKALQLAGFNLDNKLLIEMGLVIPDK